MRLRGEPIDDGGEVLGGTEETEFTFLLVPVRTFELVHEVAEKKGMSVAEVFQRALLQYLRASCDEDEAGHPEGQAPHAGFPEPAVVLKKRRS